jgi:hypothetical protein
MAAVWRRLWRQHQQALQQQGRAEEAVGEQQPQLMVLAVLLMFTCHHLAWCSWASTALAMTRIRHSWHCCLHLLVPVQQQVLLWCTICHQGGSHQELV